MTTPEEGKKNDPQKEDRLSPTNIGSDKQEKGYEGANLSHDELNEKFDLYSKVGGQMEPYFAVQKIKARYGKEIEKLEASRIQADINYASGITTGLPHANYRRIKEDREQADQILRNKTAGEAKAHYDKHNSLSREFEKSRDDDMDKER